MNIAQTTQETLGLMKESLAKTVMVQTGLNAYDLQAPAKNLYPTITPLRNSIPRVARLNPGDAARWRTINSITGSGYDAMGWVPEGQRSASMSYLAVPKTAPYLTLGEEDTVTFEAEAAAQGFEDINATATLRILQKTMRKEEHALLGGNASLALGQPNPPTAGFTGSQGTSITAGNYSVIVVALTFEGYSNSTAPTFSGTTLINAGAVATTKTIIGNDGNPYTLNGGSSKASANTLVNGVTAGSIITASLATIPAGAVAYAWFVGPVNSEALQAITTINSVSLPALAPAGTQLASTVNADHSLNAQYAFDGLLTVGFNPLNSAYVQALATGTAGTGTPLTGSGRGSVNEIDNMLVQMWNTYRLSPTVLYVNAQEQKNITAKVLTNNSGPLVHYNVAADTDNSRPYGVSASGVVRWYYNPFSVDGGFDIPLKVHPDLPPGTILAYCESLPVWYQSNQTPNVAEVMTRRDYYRIDWPIVTRAREFGVYTEETLAVYAPFGVGILTNIGNG